MKIVLLVFLMSGFVFFNDNKSIENVCYNASIKAYEEAIDIKRNQLVLNKILFEERFEYFVDNNLVYKSLYRDIYYSYAYKERIVINVYYQKFFIPNSFCFSLDGEL